MGASRSTCRARQPCAILTGRGDLTQQIGLAPQMCVTAIIGCSRRGIMRSKGWLARRRFDGLAFRKGVEVSSSHQMEVVETIKSFTSGLRSRRRRSREFVIAIAVVEAAYRTLLLVLSQRTASDTDASHEAKEDVRLRLGRWLALALEFGARGGHPAHSVAPS